MRFREYGEWLRGELGCRAQKLSVDAGFGCPNRDGRTGAGGCAYCDNRAFTPAYCLGLKGVARQLEEGKRFFARKYPDMRYLAYFQSYTGTYAPLPRLRAAYEEALAVPGVVGLVIATRPDCVPPPVLDLLEELSRRAFLVVEYGVESASDETLRRVGRGHDFACSARAIEETARRGIRAGAHMILGFPWESRGEVMRQARLVARLPLTTLKLHQLQVIRGTRLARDYERAPWPSPTAREYVELALDYLSAMPPSLVVERFVSQSPPSMVLAPRWGLRNHEVADLIRNARLPGS